MKGSRLAPTCQGLVAQLFAVSVLARCSESPSTLETVLSQVFGCSLHALAFQWHALHHGCTSSIAHPLCRGHAELRLQRFRHWSNFCLPVTGFCNQVIHVCRYIALQTLCRKTALFRVLERFVCWCNFLPPVPIGSPRHFKSLRFHIHGFASAVLQSITLWMQSWQAANKQRSKAGMQRKVSATSFSVSADPLAPLFVHIEFVSRGLLSVELPCRLCV